MAFQIEISPKNCTIPAQKGDLLADKILEAGIDLSLYCHKQAVCGKCFVEIVEGYSPPLKDREKTLLQQKDLNQNFRLACQYRIESNLKIRIPDSSLIQKTFMLQAGKRLPLPIDPAVKKHFLELKPAELGDPQSLLDQIREKLGKKNLHIGLSVLKKLPEIAQKKNHQVTVGLYAEKEILDIELGDTTQQNFGIAIDVGTTTLVVELVDLNNGKSLDFATANNSQMKYGADIVSRITYAFQDPQNLSRLNQTIIKSLSSMIHKLLKKNKINSSQVYDLVLAGNTAMNHLVAGVPVSSLAVSPYFAVFSQLPAMPAHDLGFKINPSGKAYIVPNIKSFVGGDISAGIMASDLINQNGNTLFVDLGTNGEIVLKTGKKCIATSTAAGPAFEGMNISSGMLALPGAIYKAEKKQKLKLFTIGDAAPKGICGTGLIDLIAILLKQGKISSSGQIFAKNGKITLAPNISILQKDVREIQLAVAAIKSGIALMLQKYRLKKEDLDRIFIAGAFGNYLNIPNSQILGLLPDIDPTKIEFIGNSALAGAKAILLSLPMQQKTGPMTKKIQYISLATDPHFQDCFIKALEFGQI